MLHVAVGWFGTSILKDSSMTKFPYSTKLGIATGVFRAVPRPCCAISLLHRTWLRVEGSNLGPLIFSNGICFGAPSTVQKQVGQAGSFTFRNIFGGQFNLHGKAHQQQISPRKINSSTADYLVFESCLLSKTNKAKCQIRGRLQNRQKWNWEPELEGNGLRKFSTG